MPSLLPPAFSSERFCSPIPLPLLLFRHEAFSSSNRTVSTSPSLNFFSVFLSFGLVISKLYPISLLGFFPLLRLWSFSSLRISLQSWEGRIISRFVKVVYANITVFYLGIYSKIFKLLTNFLFFVTHLFLKRKRKTKDVIFLMRVIHTN